MLNEALALGANGAASWGVKYYGSLKLSVMCGQNKISLNGILNLKRRSHFYEIH